MSLSDYPYTGSLNDKLRRYYSDKGFDQASLNEQEYSFLKSFGFSDLSLNDRRVKYQQLMGTVGNPVKGFVPESLDLNFLTQKLSHTLSFSRASAATMIGADGLLTWAPHNLLPNSQVIGAYAAGTSNGLTWSIVGSGVGANGGLYVDFRAVGTITSTFSEPSWAEGSTGFTTVPSGVRVSSAWVVQVIASNGAIGFIAAKHNEHDSANTYVATRSGTGPSVAATGTSARSVASSVTASNTAKVAMNFAILGATSGTVFDVTVRVSDGSIVLGNDTGVSYPTSGTAYYGPRYEYDPVTLAPVGLLIEEQRTNLLTRHVQAGVWSGYSTATLGTNADGPTISGFSLVRYTADTSTGAHFTYGAAVTPSASTTVTISCVLSYVNRDWVQLCPSTNHAQATDYVNFNLTTGVWGSVGATVLSKSAQKIAEGTWRLSMTYTTLATSLSGAGCVVCVRDSDTATRIPPSSAGSSVDWGYQQYEVGSFPTSIIPTYGTAATRAAEVANMTNAGLLGRAAGTLMAEGTFRSSALPTVQIFAQLDNGSSAERVFLRRSGTWPGVGNIDLVVASAFQAIPSPSPNTITNDVVTRMAVSWGSGKARQALNGVAGSDGAAQSPTLSRISAGGVDAGSFSNGHTRRIRYWPVALPASTLQLLTSGNE